MRILTRFRKEDAIVFLAAETKLCNLLNKYYLNKFTNLSKYCFVVIKQQNIEKVLHKMYTKVLKMSKISLKFL